MYIVCIHTSTCTLYIIKVHVHDVHVNYVMYARHMHMFHHSTAANAWRGLPLPPPHSPTQPKSQYRRLEHGARRATHDWGRKQRFLALAAARENRLKDVPQSFSPSFSIRCSQLWLPRMQMSLGVKIRCAHQDRSPRGGSPLTSPATAPGPPGSCMSLHPTAQS